MDRRFALVLLVLLAIQLVSSGWHVLGKKALDDGTQPLVFALYRELISSVSIFVLALSTDGRDCVGAIPREDWPRFLTLGLCSFATVVGAVVALAFIPASTYAMLQPLCPVIALVVSVLLRLERLTWLKAAGVAMAAGGALVVTIYSPPDAGAGGGGGNHTTNHTSYRQRGKEGGGEGEGGGSSSLASGGLLGSGPAEQPNPVVGTLIGIGQCFGTALLIVLQKKVLARHPPNTVTAWYYLCGTLLTLVAVGTQALWGSGPLGHLHASDFRPQKPEVWVALVYASLVATVFNFCAMAWCNTQVSATLRRRSWQWPSCTAA